MTKLLESKTLVRRFPDASARPDNPRLAWPTPQSSWLDFAILHLRSCFHRRRIDFLYRGSGSIYSARWFWDCRPSGRCQVREYCSRADSDRSFWKELRSPHASASAMLVSTASRAMLNSLSVYFVVDAEYRNVPRVDYVFVDAYVVLVTGQYLSHNAGRNPLPL